MRSDLFRNTFWALSDQAIVSAGNFLTNLLLIRTLVPESYGAYSLILNVILFLNNLHANMVCYTVCMKGAQSDEAGLRTIASGGLIATLIGTTLSALVVTLACLQLHRAPLIPMVISATMCWQLQETLRTAFISRRAYKRALAGDAVSYLGQAAILAVLCYYKLPGLEVIFGVMLVTSLIAATAQAIQITPANPDSRTLRQFFGELWRLGKWSTLAKVVAFLTFQAFPWVLAYANGLSAVASFQALFILVALSNPLLLAFNNLTITSIASRPQASRLSALGSASEAMRLAAIVLGCYFGALAIWGRFFMHIIYGYHSPYLANARLVPYFALAYALESIAMFAGAILGGLAETRYNFLAQFWAMLASVIIVFPWILHSGLSAAAMGFVIVAGTRAIAGWYLALRGIEKENRCQSTTVALLNGI